MKYEPLLGHLRLHKPHVTYGFLVLGVRRILLIYLAMFEERNPWLHVLIFSLLTLVSLSFKMNVRPYKGTQVNLISIANEVFCLLISCLILPLQDFKYDPEQLYTMAFIPVYSIYACTVLNVTYNIGADLKELY